MISKYLYSNIQGFAEVVDKYLYNVSYASLGKMIHPQDKVKPYYLWDGVGRTLARAGGVNSNRMFG